MVDSGSLGEAILLRLSDRLAQVEQQTNINTASMQSLSAQVMRLNDTIVELTDEYKDIQRTSGETLRIFDDMRKPLQGLLEMKERFSGVWLVMTAFVMVAAYLFQPLLTELYHWRLGL